MDRHALLRVRRTARIPLLAPFLCALLALASCSDESGPVDIEEPGPDPLVYATFVTPRGGPERDPLLADAYQHVGADGYQVASLWLLWSDVAVGPVLRDWTPLNLHVQRAHQKGIRLSIVLDLYPGGDPDFPRYRWPLFPGYENPDLYHELALFLAELAGRGGDDIAYLWLGQEPERYLDLYPDDGGTFAAFFAAVADTARALFPDATIGIALDPVAASSTGAHREFTDALRTQVDMTGLVFAPDVIGAPEPALAAMTGAAGRYLDRPASILEIGYPSSGGATDEAAQDRFMGLFLAWMRSRPSTLEMVCWMPLHDVSSALADSLARQRRPFDEDERARYAAALATHGMRRLDGTPKASRQTFVEDRP